MLSEAKHLRLLLGIHSIGRAAIFGRLAVISLSAQINPCGVQGLDEFDLSYSLPALQLLLACDRLRDRGVSFEPDQPIAVISSSKAIVLLPFVLEHSFMQVAGDADIESMAATGHDVGEIRALVHGGMLRRSRDLRCDKSNRRCFAALSMTARWRGESVAGLDCASGDKSNRRFFSALSMTVRWRGESVAGLDCT